MISIILAVISAFSGIIGFILMIYVPTAIQKNLNNNDPKYIPHNIEAMKICSYIFFAIAGISLLCYIILLFLKKSK